MAISLKKRSFFSPPLRFVSPTPKLVRLATALNNNNKPTSAFNKYSFRNAKNIDGNNFRNDLETALAPLLFNLMSTSVSQEALDEHFNELLSAISNVIDKHAPVQTATRKQKKNQKKTG